MKKFASICVFAAVMLTFFIGCSHEKYIHQRFEVDALVIGCKVGASYPDPVYLFHANYYLVKNNIALYSLYHNLAYANMTYDYKVTVQIDGRQYVVTRDQEYPVGGIITVILEKTFNENGKLIRQTYN